MHRTYYIWTGEEELNGKKVGGYGNLLMLLSHHNRSTASCTIFAFLTAQNCLLNEQDDVRLEILEFCACSADIADIQTDTMICAANVQSAECQKDYISRQNDPFCSTKGVVS